MCSVHVHQFKKKTMLSFSTVLCPAGGLHRYGTSDPHRLAIDGAYLCAPSFTQIHAGNNCFMYPKENSKKNPFHVSTNLRGLTSTFFIKKKISQRLIVTERGGACMCYVRMCLRAIDFGWREQIAVPQVRKNSDLSKWFDESAFLFWGLLFIFVIRSFLFLFFFFSYI